MLHEIFFVNISLAGIFFRMQELFSGQLAVHEFFRMNFFLYFALCPLLPYDKIFISSRKKICLVLFGVGVLAGLS